MNNSLVKLFTLGSLIASGLVFGSGNAQAAALVGNVSISPAFGVTSGVDLIGTGLTFNGKPVTAFDFKPDTPSTATSGTVFEVTGTGSFASFIGDYGTIQDLSLADVSAFLTDAQGGANYVKNDFIRVYDRGANNLYAGEPGIFNVDPGAEADDILEFAFDLEDISESAYTTTGTGSGLSTSVSVTFTGFFRNLGDGSGDKSAGTFNANVNFPGLNTAAVQALFDQAGEVSRNNNYSTQGVAATTKTPESSTVGALIGFGLIGSSFALKKKVKLG